VDTHTVVIGAGVVGLAIGCVLARTGREVVVVEREAAVGAATSSRNSGVIHAGIYYPTGSLKARLCVRGNGLLYDFCANRCVSHARCGKLIVATTDSEARILRQYEQTARLNNVVDLRRLTAAEVTELEPELHCVAALHSPDTGIVDVHELMSALQAEIESRGGQVVLNTAMVRGEVIEGGFGLTFADAGETRITCSEFVNSAGLDAPSVAARMIGLDPGDIPPTRFARGRYYVLRGAAPFRRLVYPMPEGGGLGIHATLDLAGRVRFGPDVEWIDRVDYRFGPDRRDEFAAAIRRYYPSLDAARLSEDYTGIRPKIYGPTEPQADFRIDGPSRHGIRGLVNLFGIESPGLTSALAIGETVATLLAA